MNTSENKQREGGGVGVEDGGPAFPFIGTMPATGIDNPIPLPVFHVGMSLRDYFAAKAAGSMMLAASVVKQNARSAFELKYIDDCVRSAYQLADAMLAARKASVLP